MTATVIAPTRVRSEPFGLLKFCLAIVDDRALRAS